MQNLAFIFPGQGSQRVGMGKSLSENYAVALRTFQEADEILSMNLSQLCFEGPEERLRQTEYTQLAVLTCSVATLRVLEENGLPPDVVAGHSLGEYSALTACGVLKFEDALKLVQLRANFMAEASHAQPSGMVAVLGLDVDELSSIFEKASVNGAVQIANYNCPGQIVIAGERRALQKVINTAKFESNMKASTSLANSGKFIPLPVSGAFHSSFMKPAADSLKKVIKNVSFQKPRIKFISNVTANYVSEPEQIRELLISQIVSPVQWESSIRRMIEDRVTKFIEVGPGRVLSGLVRRIYRNTETFNVETSTDVGNVLKALSKWIDD